MAEGTKQPVWEHQQSKARSRSTREEIKMEVKGVDYVLRTENAGIAHVQEMFLFYIHTAHPLIKASASFSHLEIDRIGSNGNHHHSQPTEVTRGGEPKIILAAAADRRDSEA